MSMFYHHLKRNCYTLVFLCIPGGKDFSNNHYTYTITVLGTGCLFFFFFFSPFGINNSVNCFSQDLTNSSRDTQPKCTACPPCTWSAMALYIPLGIPWFLISGLFTFTDPSQEIQCSVCACLCLPVLSLRSWLWTVLIVRLSAVLLPFSPLPRHPKCRAGSFSKGWLLQLVESEGRDEL